MTTPREIAKEFQDWLEAMIKLAKVEEREMCAKVADNYHGRTSGEIAAAIRARGED